MAKQTNSNAQLFHIWERRQWRIRGFDWRGWLLFNFYYGGCIGNVISTFLQHFILFNTLIEKISLSTVSESRDDLSFVTVPPAVEKTRSDDTDVAGTHRIFLANEANFG